MKTRWVALLMALLGTGACSKQQASAPDDSWSPEAAEVLKAEVTAGGVPTTYSAYFEAGQLQRISEVLKPAAGANGARASGDYAFKGARLLQYRGTALLSEENIELSFDMRGVLTGSSGAISDAELAAILNRAQLLRSLALARQSTQTHGT